MPSPSPAQSPWCTTLEVTWVNERTKTRSKKSSSGVTRSSPPEWRCSSRSIGSVCDSTPRFYHT